MNNPKTRSPLVCVLFSMLTCGIYGLYWYVVTTNEIETSLQRPDGSCRSGATTILFSFVTCGIYMFYWWYKEGKRVAQMQEERGIRAADNSVLHLVLMLFGVGALVNMILMQSELNRVAAQPQQ